jgi:phage terminase large subunit GpA-like protein
VKKSTIELILAKRGEREPLIVPAWAVALTCGIDVQKYGFWFTVWAWSREMQSAMIHYGYLVSWDDVHELVFNTAFDVEGGTRKMMIWRAAMDIGGGKDSSFGEDWTKTEEIVAWIRDNGQGVIWAVKGMSGNSTGQKIKASILDKMPGEKGGVIPGGLTLYMLDTDQLKDNVTWRFGNRDIDPQPLELHSQVGEDYALQMTAEEKQQARNGLWHWVRVRKDNHLFDATIYAHAAADFQWLGGVKILNDAQYAENHVTGRDKATMIDPRQQVRTVQRPDWLTRRR